MAAQAVINAQGSKHCCKFCAFYLGKKSLRSDCSQFTYDQPNCDAKAFGYTEQQFKLQVVQHAGKGWDKKSVLETLMGKGKMLRPLEPSELQQLQQGQLPLAQQKKQQ